MDGASGGVGLRRLGGGGGLCEREVLLSLCWRGRESVSKPGKLEDIWLVKVLVWSGGGLTCAALPFHGPHQVVGSLLTVQRLQQVEHVVVKHEVDQVEGPCVPTDAQA